MAKQVDELSFAGISQLIHEKSDTAIIKTIDNVAGALIVLSPVVLGPAALPVLGLLGAKNQLTKLGSDAIASMGSADTTGLTRDQVLSAAYCLMCYSAFFEAADKTLGKVRSAFRLKATEKLQLTDQAIERYRTQAVVNVASDENPVTSYQFQLPHPTSTLEDDSRRLATLYDAMTLGLSRFIEGLSAFESATEGVKDKISALLRGLPAKAAEMYRGQYLALCKQHNEFYVWANLHEHELTRRTIRIESDRIAAIMSLRSSTLETIDMGLAQVQLALDKISHDRPPPPSTEILNNLSKIYIDRINQPIIIDDYGDVTGFSLKYPSRSEIFVPQSFRALRYGSTNLRALEDESTWSQASAQQSIGAFLLSLLQTPESVASPVLILGHPGSGKSLLTELLAARFAASQFTPIRIELRDINADADIQTQIEEQVRRSTGRVENWAAISDACKDRPPLVILDGYDELLQASGRVFSSYIMKVASFQAREAQLDRPLRVVLTSRITLIDKAQVPNGATVIRLDEFDEVRQQLWVEAWNRANTSYFSSTGVKPLSIPSHQQISTMARQPLLLLMLALYDSACNQLADDRDLKETQLYDSLLRRFIDRECRKGEQGVQYGALEESERRESVDKEMRRLGVAAIGMYNRRSLHISKAELERDISYFATGRATSASLGGMPLGEAELLLGSFFFVYESKTTVLDSAGDRNDKLAAYEFLHNTFGEFLVADFIVAALLGHCGRIRKMNESGFSDVVIQQLASGDGLPDTWLASLMFAPLYSRPVVLRMFREWAHQAILAESPADNYVTEFDQVLYTQYARMRVGASLPCAEMAGSEHPFPKDGALGHASMFTINLLLLRVALSASYTFRPPGLDAQQAERAWHGMTHVWRATQGMSELAALGQILATEHRDGYVVISYRDTWTGESSAALESIHHTAAALGDSIITGLSGWALQDVADARSVPSLEDLQKLPMMDVCGLASLMHDRMLLRDIATTGLDSVDQSRETIHSRLMPTRSPERLVLGSRASRRTVPVQFMSDADPLTILKRPAEIATSKWITERYLFHRSVRRSDALGESIVATRAILAADIVAAEGGAHQLGRSGWLTEVAQKLAGRGADVLPNEVVLELLANREAGNYPHLVEKLMSGGVSPWVIASRSVATFDRLCEVAEVVGRYDWIDACLSILGGDNTDRFGPDLVRELGMYRSLRVLTSGASRAVLENYVRLHGILTHILTMLPVEDPVRSLSCFLQVSNKAPWLIDAELSPTFVAEVFELESLRQDGLVAPLVDDLLERYIQVHSQDRGRRAKSSSPRPTRSGKSLKADGESDETH